MSTFDWHTLNQPLWSPLSSFRGAAEKVDTRLYALAPGVYAVADPERGSEQDPGVGFILWAESRSVARAIHGRQKPKREAGGAAPPPDLPGLESLTFGAVMAHERNKGGSRPQRSATYGYKDGEFLTSEIRTIGREYYFESPNPMDDDEVMAIRFYLR